MDAPIITLGDISGKASYTPYSPDTRGNRHIGQRKLFLNEVQYLTRSAGYQDYAIIVYAGAAPSNKTAFLAQLFPKCIFILVDPNPFAVFAPTFWDKNSIFGPNKELPMMLVTGSQEDGLRRHVIENAMRKVKSFWDSMIHTGAPASDDPRARLFIFNTYYTPEHSAVIKETFPGERIFFLSDIRTSINDTRHPSDLDIIWNGAQQYIWTAILGAGKSMMKWRYPHRNPEDTSMVSPNPFTLEDFRISELGKYIDETGKSHEFAPIDFLANYYAGELKYPAGETFIQPWARIDSAETRLIFSPTSPIVVYPEHKDYEESLFFYNSRLRSGPRDNLALSGASEKQLEYLGIDNCNDCALETRIWLEYISSNIGSSLDELRADSRTPNRLRGLIKLLIDATGRRPCHPNKVNGKK